MSINKDNLIHTDNLSIEIASEDEQFVRLSFRECVDYIASMRWCSAVLSVWYGGGLPGKADVFLVELLPSQDSGADEHVWVVCGDLPVAYIRADLNSTPEQAMSDYVSVMSSWVKRVRAGESLENEYPVHADPTMQNADLLDRRLEFISNELLGTEMFF